MRLRALIWDVDGTILESEELHRAAFNRAFGEFGLDWSWDRELYGRLLAVAGGKERIMQYAFGFRREELRALNLPALVPRLHARKTEIYNELLASSQVAPRPGVTRLMAEAREAGLRQAIATTTSRVNVATLLERLSPEVRDAFACVITGEDVRRKKPDPEVYVLALEGLGLPPERCLALEDSANGVRAAVAAGLRVVAAPGEYARGEDFSAAAAVVEHLGEGRQPARTLRGPELARGVVDVAWLDELLASGGVSGGGA